jgi:hypothetical protein
MVKLVPSIKMGNTQQRKMILVNVLCSSFIVDVLKLFWGVEGALKGHDGWVGR